MGTGSAIIGLQKWANTVPVIASKRLYSNGRHAQQRD
jgi:hypothetical protein